MRMKLLLGLLLAFLCLPQAKLFSQDNVGIGTTNPRVTAILDLFSDNQGLLLPRVDITNMTLSGPDNGMIVFDTVIGDILVWDGTQFLSLSIGDTARWGVNGSAIYSLNSGNVGIGNTSPGSKFQVEADVLTNQFVGRFINTNTGSQDGAAIYATSTSTTANWGYGVRAEGNYLGVDAVSSAGGFAGLRAQSGGALYALEVLGDGASTAGMHLDANGATYGAIFENGRVGIGTTVPGEMLHVQADSNNGFVSIVAENTNANGLSSFDLVNDVNRMEWRFEGSSLGGEYFLYDDNAGVGRIVVDQAGYVGIGDWSPDTQLDVTDSLPAAFVSLEIENKHATGAATLNIWNDNTVYAIGVDGSSAGNNLDDEFYIFSSPAGEFSFVIDTGGNVGIGNVVDPLVQLHVDGDGLFNGFIGLNDLGVAPGVTNNRMYNLGGNLFWDGNQLLTAADTAIWATDGVDIWNKTIAGGIGIGTSSPNGNYAANVGNSGRQGALRVDQDYAGALVKYGLFTDLNGSGTGAKFGNYANVNGTSASGSEITGTHNQMNPNSNSGTIYGTRTNIVASGTGARYGAFHDVDGAAGNSSSIFGVNNSLVHDGSGNVFGNAVVTGGASNGTVYANFVNIGGTGTGAHYGYYAQMSNSSSGLQYGLYVNNTAAGSGTEYGVYTVGEDYNYFQGNVGVGVINPSQSLHISGGTIRLQDFAGNGRNILTINNNGDVGYTDLADSIYWREDANNIFNKNSGKVIIGTDSVNTGKVQITTEINENIVNGYKYLSGTGGAIFRGYKARGTEASPASINGGDYISGIIGTGHDGTDFFNGGRIRFRAMEAWDVLSHGTGIYFDVADTGSTSVDTKMFLSPPGWLGIGTTVPNEQLHVEGGNIFLGRSDGSDLFIEYSADNNGVSWAAGVDDAANADFIISNAGDLSNPKLFVGGSGGSYDGQVGIGTIAPSAGFMLESNTGTSRYGGIWVENDYTGSNTQTGLRLNMINTGTGTKYSIYNQLTGTAGSASPIYGQFFSVTPSGSGTAYGSLVSMSAVGTGQRYGYGLNLNVNASNTSSIFGYRSEIDHDGSGIAYGLYSRLDGAGTNTTYGAYINNVNAGTSDYGILTTGEEQNSFSGRTGIGTITPLTGYQLSVVSNLLGGTYIDNAYTGASTQYALFVNSSNMGTGTKYGYYLNLDGTAGDASSIWGERLIVDPFGTGTAYGGQVQMSANGTGIRYGYFSNMSVAAGNSSSVYGLRSDIDQDGSGFAYGVYSRLDGSGTASTYGIYIDQQNAGSVDFGVYSQGEERNYFSGNVGIGTPNISGILHLSQANTGATPQLFIENTSSGDAALTFEVSTRNWALGIDNSNADKFMIAPNSLVSTSPAVTIETDGDMGIGTTTPQGELEVQTANNAYALFVDQNNTSGTTYGVGIFMTASSGEEYGVYASGESRNYFSGNVGIGTTAPDKILDVLDNVSGTMVDIRNTNTGTNADGLNIQLGAENNSNDFIYFTGSAGTYRGRIAHTGSGGVQYLSASDRRLKENIREYHGGLGVVLAMKPKTYNFIGKDRSQTGFIAQELQAIYPDAVNGDSTMTVEEDPMMVDYAKLTPVLTSSVQELHDIIMKQQKLIDSQKEEISELKTSQTEVQDQLDDLNAQIQSIIGTNDLDAKKDKDQ